MKPAAQRKRVAFSGNKSVTQSEAKDLAVILLETAVTGTSCLCKEIYYIYIHEERKSYLDSEAATNMYVYNTRVLVPFLFIVLRYETFGFPLLIAMPYVNLK